MEDNTFALGYVEFEVSFVFKGPLGGVYTGLMRREKLNFRYKFTVKKHVGCK